MGYTSYSSESRSLRAVEMNYATASVDTIFTQQKSRKAHESMSAMGLTIRECFDSMAHPATVPIILGLDVTGSMGRIPHDLVKEGLPKLMGNIIQKGSPDAALCFVAVGDHEVDGHPLQVGQFESGDAELDMWLTRTYLECGGGGNAGESYLLAWFFAALYTKTDAWEKRGKKGFLFTVGDEPNLKNLPARSIKELAGAAEAKDWTADELLAAAKEKWNVYHLNVMQGSRGRDSLAGWQQVLGKNCIQVDSFKDIPDIIANIVIQNTDYTPAIDRTDIGETDTQVDTPIML